MMWCRTPYELAVQSDEREDKANREKRVGVQKIVFHGRPWEMVRGVSCHIPGMGVYTKGPLLAIPPQFRSDTAPTQRFQPEAIKSRNDCTATRRRAISLVRS